MSPGPESISSCLEPSGDLNQGSRLLQEFQAFTAIQFPHFPFWAPETTGSSPLLEKYQRGPFVIKMGTIGQFPPEEIAVMLDAALKRFQQKKLFGDFDWSNVEERRDLTTNWISDFSDSRLVFMVQNLEQSQILGGCMIVPGKKSDSQVINLIGNHQSSLPTFWSLNANLNGHHQLASVPETQAVCYTRFFRASTERMIFPNSDAKLAALRQFSMETLSGMALVTARWAEQNGHLINLGVLDTHDPKIVAVLLNHYGGILLDEHPTPTPQVNATPLKWHYGLEGIQVIGFDFNQQLQIARDVNASLGEKIPLY